MPPQQRGGGASSSRNYGYNRSAMNEVQEQDVEIGQAHENVVLGGQEAMTEGDMQLIPQAEINNLIRAGAHVEKETLMQEVQTNSLQGNFSLALDLALPVAEGENVLHSPSIYSSASDSSLRGPNLGQGGMWKMTLTEESLNVDDLDIDDMMVDQQLMDDMLQELAEIPLHQPNEEAVMEPRHIAMEISPYKQTALKELGIEGSVRNDGSGIDAHDMKEKEEAARIASEMKRKELEKMPKKGVDLGEEIILVMKKVERAMETVGDKKQEGKMKQVIATGTDEMRQLVKEMKDDEYVGAMRFNEDGAILLLSSGSSGESGDKKRKRKNVTDRRGSVASRLRKKDKKEGAEKDGGVHQVGYRKIPKMAVRKIKVSAKKPATSLTLAPPTLGLPAP